jgi:hypothetical protein
VPAQHASSCEPTLWASVLSATRTQPSVSKQWRRTRSELRIRPLAIVGLIMTVRDAIALMYQGMIASSRGS